MPFTLPQNDTNGKRAAELEEIRKHEENARKYESRRR